MSPLTDELDRLGIAYEDRKSLVLIPCRVHPPRKLCIWDDGHATCGSGADLATCLRVVPPLRRFVRSSLLDPEPPPPGQRYFEEAGLTILIPASDRRPNPCRRYGFGHDSLACVDCIRARALAKRIALADDDTGEGWARESLTEVEPVPPATILEIAPGDFLLRRGWVTLVHGAFASGKTPLCYLAVVEQVKAGNLALIVDHEMGKAQAKALLLELGLTEEQIDAGVYYRYQPPPLSPAGQRRIEADVLASGRELAVVVIDSLTVSMGTVPGTNDNDVQDVTTWASELPIWMADQFDAAVVVIDHSGVSDGDRPSGSHKKREFPQFHIWCEKVTAFSRANPEAGKSNLKVMKDRSGERPIGKTVAVLRTRAGGSFYLALPEPLKDGEVEVALDRQPENATDADVLDTVRATGTEGIMKTDLTGKGEAGQYRRASVDRLVLQGRLIERPDGRGGRGRRYWVPELAP